MESQYLKLSKIAQELQKISQELLAAEKQKTIENIISQMELFSISFEHLEFGTPSAKDVNDKEADSTTDRTGWHFEESTQNAFLTSIKPEEKQMKEKFGTSFLARTAEQNKRLSQTLKGRKLSEETKNNMKLECATRPVPRSFGQPIRINGVNYVSISAASKALNVSTTTIMSRCKNKNRQFNDWVYLPLNVEMLKQA